jgi:hypothetical protein
MAKGSLIANGISGGNMNNNCLLLGLFIFTACASTPESADTYNMSSEQYEENVEGYSDHVQKYDGPYNVLDVGATILNSHVIEAQTLRQATIFQWDKVKFQAELQNKQKAASEKTEIFVSFFTPDKKSGDLLRANTLWKTTLKVEGKEIPGLPKKMSLLPVEIKSLYPQHNRWSTGYLITFDLPVTSIETKISELIITGPVGTASLKFNPIKNMVHR